MEAQISLLENDSLSLPKIFVGIPTYNRPEGCAHGFQSLEDDIELMYMLTSPYCKEAEGGVRFDDPKVGIQWPLTVTIISEKDKSFKDY